MKKLAAILTAAGLICSLCGCKAGSPDNPGSGNSTGTERTTIESGISESKNQISGNAETSDGSLTIFNESNTIYNSCYTSDGYYYLTSDTEQLKDGRYARHMMYMDFATRTEIYLCSNAGCSHDTADCPSVFLFDEFQSDPQIFIYHNQLYIFAKDADMDGTLTTIYASEESLAPESAPAVLYRANLDGNKREKIYTFASGLTLEDMVLGDDSGLYFITKKLSNNKSGNSTYTTSSERNLIFLNPETRKETVICSLNFNDNVTYGIRGCFDHTLILYGTDYGEEASMEERMTMDDDSWKALYEKSSDVVALLDLTSGIKKEVYRISNSDYKNSLYSTEFSGHFLYLSKEKSGSIQKIDLTDGSETLLATLPQNNILHILDDMLCCRSWNLVSDYTFYFVNSETGEISHSSLVNKSLGWSLEFQAELESNILVIYDYDADATGDDSYEINQYRYALISKKDLYAGNDNFLPITMIGKGE